MDIVKAKKFIFDDHCTNVIYVSKDLDKILEKADNLVCIVKAVVDTPNGEKIFDMDTAYDGEPIIMRCIMHYDSYFSYYHNRKIVEL